MFSFYCGVVLLVGLASRRKGRSLFGDRHRDTQALGNLVRQIWSGMVEFEIYGLTV